MTDASLPPLPLLLSGHAGADAARHRAIWAYDGRLARVARTTRERAIGQMRLAWWNDVMEDDAGLKGQGGPVVDALRATGAMAAPGLIAMIGKAERGPVAIEAIKKHKSAYLMAVGGAAYLVARAIKEAKVVGFEDLGMEAIYAFTVKDMPVSVAVDSLGESVHVTGPQIWKAQIEEQALELI